MKPRKTQKPRRAPRNPYNAVLRNRRSVRIPDKRRELLDNEDAEELRLELEDEDE